MVLKKKFYKHSKIKKKISLKSFEKNLYTKNMPQPDILIRTGGHNRLSNFMLWQLVCRNFFFKKIMARFHIYRLIKDHT